MRDIHSEEVNSAVHALFKTHTLHTLPAAEEISEEEEQIKDQNICIPVSTSSLSPEDAVVVFIADAFG